MENKLPLAGFPTLPRPNTPFELRSKKVLRSEVANCRPKSDHPLTLVSGPLLGLGAQNLYQGLTARRVDGRRHSCPLSHILNRVRHILTYVCLGNDTGTLAMSWTNVPGLLTATGPFFDRIALLAGCTPDGFVQVIGLEDTLARWLHSFAFGACKEGGDALVR